MWVTPWVSRQRMFGSMGYVSKCGFKNVSAPAKFWGSIEFLDASFRPGFLHLCEKKFWLILRSGYPTPEDPFVSVEFVYCIILDLPPDEDSSQWNVSILSDQKYLLDKYLNLLDCLILWVYCFSLYYLSNKYFWTDKIETFHCEESSSGGRSSMIQ